MHVLIPLVLLIIYLVKVFSRKSKGDVRCNDCGYVGKLRTPMYHSDKLVCAKCGSTNWTEMSVVNEIVQEKERKDQAGTIEKQREKKASRNTLESRPHCQNCQGRADKGDHFCSNCGSTELISHEDWMLSPDKEVRKQLKIGQEIQRFRDMAQGQKYCPSCDSFAGDTGNFCARCGNELTEVSDEFLVRKYSALYPDFISSIRDLQQVEHLP